MSARSCGLYNIFIGLPVQLQLNPTRVFFSLSILMMDSVGTGKEQINPVWQRNRGRFLQGKERSHIYEII